MARIGTNKGLFELLEGETLLEG
ncbi:TPA: ferredoxin, partial [Neisseria gonorrhoeae]